MKSTVLRVTGINEQAEKRYVMAFPDGRFMWFGWGVFNEWYIGYTPFPEADGTPPQESLNFDQDKYMLGQLKKLQDEYGPKVMSFMWSIYHLVPTRHEMSPVVPAQEAWRRILSFAGTFQDEDHDRVAHLFGYVYYAMISEENYEDTKLGKKLKLLGIYQTLLEDMEVDRACCYSRRESAEILLGTPEMRLWERLQLECEARGIV